MKLNLTSFDAPPVIQAVGRPLLDSLTHFSHFDTLRQNHDHNTHLNNPSASPLTPHRHRHRHTPNHRDTPFITNLTIAPEPNNQNVLYIQPLRLLYPPNSTLTLFPTATTATTKQPPRLALPKLHKRLSLLGTLLANIDDRPRLHLRILVHHLRRGSRVAGEHRAAGAAAHDGDCACCRQVSGEEVCLLGCVFLNRTRLDWTTSCGIIWGICADTVC